MRVGVGGEGGAYAGVAYDIRGEFDDNGAFAGTGLSGTAVFGSARIEGGGTDFTVEGVERENQYTVYSSTEIGIDQRSVSTVVYDENSGAPLAYRVEANDFTRENERPEIGTATAQEAGSVQDVIGWARWAKKIRVKHLCNAAARTGPGTRLLFT